MTDIAAIRKRYEAMLPVLDEQRRRRFAAAEAMAFGRGGLQLLCEITGVARSNILTGIKEIKAGEHAGEGRIRKPGAGRKAKTDSDPTLLEDLKKLVEPETSGDPMKPLLWTTKSLRKLSKALKDLKHDVSPSLVGKLLRGLGYSLQGNKKSCEKADHPDRDEQFENINTQIKKHLTNGDPVISVDTKKKELVGNFKNNGQEWHQKGAPDEVNVHDFADKQLGRASPYGVYDIGDNKGWVSVGQSCDTAAFAVNAIRCWWCKMGRPQYAGAKSLMITADCGGSNGYRLRLWKVELQKLADELGFPITVCHLPPGTSKWNRIEHRLFSFISKNWRGKPLRTYRTIVELISATTTEAGLRVRAELDENQYPKGIKVTDAELAAINLEKHTFHGEWNYTIAPHQNA